MSLGKGQLKILADLIPGDGIGGSFIIFWPEFPCTALEFIPWEFRMVASKEEEGEELMLEALKLFEVATLPLIKLAGS